MRSKTFVMGMACALLAALPAWPQGIPTGTLSGHVRSTDKQALAGVTISVTSISLQGTRVTVSNGNGDYLLALLPPGSYKVSFALEGAATVERTVEVAASQTANIDVELALNSVQETIVVTGASDTEIISPTTEASTTYTQKFVEQLPLNRALRETVLMTPGTNPNGPNNAITISGAQSFENLYLVNGVEIQDNIRGTPFNLYIEDAIQETTTSTSGVSAEYGRFQGGVVNIITKSGGNDVHGSFRTSFSNNSWSSATPLRETLDKTPNERYEATLGGFLLKDRIWYFGSGRNLTTDTTATTAVTNISFPQNNKETRLEGKLTLSPTSGQRLVGAYTKIDRTENSYYFTPVPVLDLASTYSRQLPQELFAGQYSGVFASNFYAEGQYSKRKFSFVHSGGQFTDLVRGTPIADGTTGFRYNSPTFCGVCKPELRNNDEFQAKGSWFASAPSFGSHDVTFGYVTYNDVRQSDNHQSGTDFLLQSSGTQIVGTTPYAVFRNDGVSARIVWFPIAITSKGTAFRTNSLYANDRWRLSSRFSFNLGVRYDKNDGKNSQGLKVAKDSKVSPRLGAAYDLKGDGDWVINATYGTYVAGLANGQGDNTSAAGNPSVYQFGYKGPPINTPGQPLTTNADAIQQIFNWFNANGGTNNASLLLANPTIPGGTLVIRGSLKSPSTDEYTLGFTKRVGNRGFARLDYIHRTGTDFYLRVTDLSTGRTVLPNGSLADLGVLTNASGQLHRKYDGLHTQLQYRAFDRLNLGLNYTLAHARGNFDGETAGSGPVASIIGQYPEYKDPAAWNNRAGDLGIDQRHNLQFFGVYEILRGHQHRLSASFIERYASGTPYGAIGNVADRSFVTNPGYVRPPTTVTYFYSARDAFRTDNISATDLAVSYSFLFGALGKDAEIFLEPQVLNVFNQKGVITPNNTDVQDATNTAGLLGFNPFTTKPVEGVNWNRGPKFGKAQIPTDYQTPRTFRFSVGLRF
ncbi:MAG TPA: TonB-dependent receptor [Thermoanaerobaculia bacterium]|nr:TonB-dependent receptor [Thermoanaerobaculia bacterium]